MAGGKPTAAPDACLCTPCRLHALEGIDAILAGPHLKTLMEDGNSPFLMVEPLAFVPVRQAAFTDHLAAPNGSGASASPSPKGEADNLSQVSV